MGGASRLGVARGRFWLTGSGFSQDPYAEEGVRRALQGPATRAQIPAASTPACENPPNMSMVEQQ